MSLFAGKPDLHAPSMFHVNQWVTPVMELGGWKDPDTGLPINDGWMPRVGKLYRVVEVIYVPESGYCVQLAGLEWHGGRPQAFMQRCFEGVASDDWLAVELARCGLQIEPGAPD